MMKSVIEFPYPKVLMGSTDPADRHKDPLHARMATMLIAVTVMTMMTTATVTCLCAGENRTLSQGPPWSRPRLRRRHRRQIPVRLLCPL